MTLWRASQGAWATLAAAGESGPIRAEIYETVASRRRYLEVSIRGPWRVDLAVV